MEDRILIKKSQAGEKSAFQELIKKYHPFVYKFLLKITEDKFLAEDLTQEVFIKIIRNIEKFSVDGKAKFSTYIVTIAKNLYIDYLRKEKNYFRHESIDEAVNIEDYQTNVENIIFDKITNQKLLENLENLIDEQKIVIRLKYLEGLTLKEIGNELGLEAKTVKSRIHHGIEKLRKMVGGKSDERDK